MMKKVVISLSIIVMVMFLAGCIDYKASTAPKAAETDEDKLLAEIAQIEEELNYADNKEAKVAEEKETAKTAEELEGTTEEEVTLPELNQAEEMQELKVKENQMVKLKAKASDPDNDVIQYTFTPPLNAKGEWKTNYGDAGDYMVTITAADGVHTTEKKLKIIVERVNVPPVIEGLKDLYAKEGDAVKFEPKVSDPNGDAVTVKVSEPLESGSFMTDHDSAGEYVIKVLAGDGELDSEGSFKLTVADVNMPPEIKNLKDITVKEGETVELNLETEDLDSDEVTLTISNPVGNDGVWETKYTDHGEYAVTVTATDGKDLISKNIKITVEDVNMPPVFEDISLDVN